MSEVVRCERCNGLVELTEFDAWRSEEDEDIPASRNYLRHGRCRCGADVEVCTSWEIPRPGCGADAH